MTACSSGFLQEVYWFPMLEIENLSAGYSSQNVLQNVSLCVGAGEIAAVIGPNGCGKSTLLRCITGQLKARGGHVLVENADVSRMELRSRAKLVALLPQFFAGDDDLSVYDTVALGRTPHLSSYGTMGKRDLEIVHRVLDATSTSPLATRRIGELSGGERQRVGLARALAQEPRVLLLDEPTSNLDLRYQHELLALVRKEARHQRIAVVLVLHQINLAAAISDQMLLLQNGQTRALGTPNDVMTADNLQEVYGLPLTISFNAQSGRPQVQSAWVFDE